MGKANELIDRYVYDVTRRLPQAQRADIEKELRTLIDDMLAGRGEVKDVTLALIELGRPAELAAKYRGTKRYLIGPQVYSVYEMVMKIVLAAVAFGMTLAHVIGGITTPPQSVFLAVAGALGSTGMALVQAFAIVTVIFAVFERFGKGELWKAEDWHPRDLPEVPAGGAVIKKSDPIVALVFSGVFLVVIVAMPWLLGVGYGLAAPFIPVFNLEVLASAVWLIVLMILVGAAKEVLRLIAGRYTVRLAIVVALLNIASLVLVIVVFGSHAIWNADFLTQMQAATGASWFAGETAVACWRLVPTVIVALTAIGLITDTGVTLYRGLAYGAKGAAL